MLGVDLPVLFICYVASGYVFQILSQAPKASKHSASNMHSFRKSLAKNRRRILGLVLVVFLGTVIPFADSHLGVISPRIVYAETRIDSSAQYGVYGSASDYVVLVPAETTYAISAPYLNAINNITIPNPSNYTGPRYSISTSPIGVGWVVTPLKDSQSRVLGLKVDWQGSGSKILLLHLAYEDNVTNDDTRHLITADFADPVMGNGTYHRHVVLVLKNTLGGQVEFESGLSIISEPGKIVGFNCTRDGNAMNDLCWTSDNELMLSAIFLPPGETTTIVVDLEYL